MQRDNRSPRGRRRKKKDKRKDNHSYHSKGIPEINRRMIRRWRKEWEAESRESAS